MRLINSIMQCHCQQESLPELASPADIELLTVGESVSKSLSIDAAKLRGSSKFKSSNAFPTKQRRHIKLYC
jgi:hypothetical protein